MRKKNEYVYTGEAVPKIDKQDNAGFVINYQRAILRALVKRELLTPEQCEQCIEELEHRRG